MKSNLPALVLKLKLLGEPGFQVRVAGRIKLDGKGRILLWDAETGEVEGVALTSLESISIQPVAPVSKAA